MKVYAGYAGGASFELNHWYRSFLPHFELSLAMEFLGFSGKELEEGLKALKEKRPPEFP
ncbi:hypothetical protein TthHB5008_01570 [Thermus thermophilus]|nr:hypothetical protein TthHB5002_01570 [Thermus thermophilus]BCP99386.1 hypothetical protein TthHB5008_01570 [Thermus thermophilus]